MEIVFDLKFERTYHIETITELGLEEQYYYYPSRAKDGLTVKVTPLGCESWIGIFEFGTVTPNDILAIYTMPELNKFCVVAGGAGYIVSATNPEKWEEVRAIPIVDERCIKSHNIIMFADYTELIAYDEFGIRWKTQRLAYDSFKIIDIKDNVLMGRLWNIRNEADEIFEVNLNDGSQAGGISEL